MIAILYIDQSSGREIQRQENRIISQSRASPTNIVQRAKKIHHGKNNIRFE